MSDIQAIKYRLVGAVVIVVGFALVWWLMLDHEARRRIQEEQADLPPQTFEVERFDIDEPQPLGIRPKPDGAGVVEREASKNSEEIPTQDLPTAVMSQEPEEAAPVTEVKPAKPVASAVEAKKPVEVKKAVDTGATSIAAKTNSYSALDEKGLPESWVIQLASVKNRENAQQLQRKLLASSYPAYVKSVSTADGTIHRVLVGPKLSRQKAEETARAIEKEFRIKGIIVRFQTGYEQ